MTADSGDALTYTVSVNDSKTRKITFTNSGPSNFDVYFTTYDESRLLADLLGFQSIQVSNLPFPGTRHENNWRNY